MSDKPQMSATNAKSCQTFTRRGDGTLFCRTCGVSSAHHAYPAPPDYRALAQQLAEALDTALGSVRELRGLAWTGSRIAPDRYPEKHRADAADLAASAALSAARAAGLLNGEK